MVFASSTDFYITDIILTGTFGHEIILSAYTPGTKTRWFVSGTQNITFVNVKDNDASGGNQVDATINCSDLGNTINWLFLSPAEFSLITFQGDD